MDFIERSFGFAPDNGDGSVEWLLVLVPLTAIAAIAIRRRLAASRRDNRR